MKLKNREVMLFHTNDIHSQLDNVGRIDTILKQYREHYSSDEMVLIDIGDFMDRYCLTTEGTDGLVHRELLETMKYDVITLGNNEGLSFTHDQLSMVYGEPSTFKVVCCNMSPLDGSSLPWLLKSTIIEKNGLKLAFIGVTINYTSFYALLNWNAENPILKVQEEINKIRQDADVIIVLSHLGIRLDEQLADVCPEIDIIIGGHTHHVINPSEKRHNSLMCAAGMGGKYLGVIHISVNKPDQKPKLSGRLIETQMFDQSPEIISIVSKYDQISLEKLDSTVTILDEALYSDDFKESPLPNLLALSLSKWCGTPLSIVNTGQLLAGLPAGRVSKKDLHMICPAPINACIVKIRGKHIRQAFIESLQYEFQAKPLKGYGFRGKRLGRLAVSGFKILYKKDNNNNNNNINIYINNILLNDDKLYSVATIDMFTFRHGYTSLSEIESDETQFFVPEYIRHILADAITEHVLVEASKEYNWIEIT